MKLIQTAALLFAVSTAAMAEDDADVFLVLNSLAHLQVALDDCGQDPRPAGELVVKMIAAARSDVNRIALTGIVVKNFNLEKSRSSAACDEASVRSWRESLKLKLEQLIR